jgi:group I intron endonuclease
MLVRKLINGVYKIKCLINEKYYVGQGKVSDRFYHHKWELNHGVHKSKDFQEDWNKYGIDKFIFEIIEKIDDKQLRFERETYWIKYYNSVNNGYNQESRYGERFKDKGKFVSEETRKKLSEAGMGKCNALGKGRNQKNLINKNF